VEEDKAVEKMGQKRHLEQEIFNGNTTKHITLKREIRRKTIKSVLLQHPSQNVIFS